MLTVCTAGPISVYVRTVTTVLKSCEATAGTALQPELLGKTPARQLQSAKSGESQSLPLSWQSVATERCPVKHLVGSSERRWMTVLAYLVDRRNCSLLTVLGHSGLSLHSG